MSPDEQRIAIAEACGRTNVAPLIVKNVKHEGDDITVGIRSDDGWIPDYLNDLNAMHEAETVLTGDQQHDYECHLLRMDYPDWEIKVTHATANQRAEAFLRTLGLWQETLTQPQ